MIQHNEALLKRGGSWHYFARPHRIIAAKSVGEVLDALDEVERLVTKNNWNAAGYISYEAAPAFDSAFHVKGGSTLPLLWFGLYPEPRIIDLPSPRHSIQELRWQPTIDQSTYVDAIDQIKEFIARGMTYQVNYTMRLTSEFSGDSFDFFLNLARRQNAFAAYIDTGNHAICSASPELFFQLDGESILARPMKGTAGRGRTLEEDELQAEWLLHSEKNRAENVMIVDMVRNDLGRIAEIGSVVVSKLFAIEKYPTLFQMTSDIQAKSRASLTEILKALFPCASITGAPKVSTMKIIANLETTPRGVYTGCIGSLEPGRRAQFNVAIRTAVIDRSRGSAEYGVGGGIVWDSSSAAEYEEAILKAQVLIQEPVQFSLLETILWTPQEGFFLLEKHLNRISSSSRYFDYKLNEEELSETLTARARDFHSPKRIRVLVDQEGQISIDAAELPALGQQYFVRLAERPIDTKDVFLYHKTTHRSVYELARGQSVDCDDVILFNQNGELTEFTIGNLVVELEGKRYTPPVSCGLLAGTFRAFLVQTGEVTEKVLDKNDLQRCTKLFMINSLRKWVGVTLKQAVPSQNLGWSGQV